MFQSALREARLRPAVPAALPGRPLEQQPRGVIAKGAHGRRNGHVLAGFDAARAFFATCFVKADPRRETLFLAYLDRNARCIGLVRHDGDEAGVEWPLRAILLEAARCNASGLIVAHNHPSGDPRPSAGDCAATRRLVLAGDAIDVALVDHLLFAGADCLSFRRIGLL